MSTDRPVSTESQIEMSSLRVSISLMPRLLPGERVLSTRQWIWAASGKSLPSYRLFFLLPPIQEAGIYVSDRRILLVTYLFRIFAFEASLWFPRCAASEVDEVVQSVTAGKMPIAGRYIEIISKDPVRHWYRSPQSRIRLFVRDPQSLHDVIAQAMAGEEPL
jgi:hypothetical protein